MQMVILAGGLATRLGPLTRETPKSMLLVCGKPFLQYQLELLSRGGVEDIVLCVGHLWEQIEAYFGDGTTFGVRLRYSVEQGRLLGTGGALKQAEPLLAERFYLMYGDSFLQYNYADIASQAAPYRALMVVYRNEGRYDISNVSVHEGRVAQYEKGPPSPDLQWIDAGLSVLQRETLEMIPQGQPAGVEQIIYQELVRRGELRAYTTDQRFYEVGSAAGLEEFRALVAAGVLP